MIVKSIFLLKNLLYSMTISIFKNFPIRLGWLCYTLDSKAHAWRKQVTLQLYQNNTQYCLLLTIETGAYMWALLSPSNKRKAHFINSAIFICFFQFALLFLIFMRYLFCFLQNCWNELRLQYNLKFDWMWNFQHFSVGTIGAHYYHIVSMLLSRMIVTLTVRNGFD